MLATSFEEEEARTARKRIAVVGPLLAAYHAVQLVLHRAADVRAGDAVARWHEGSVDATTGGLLPGAVVGGRYVVERRLGAGGMGAVYAARDREHGERVALKVIQARSAHELDALRRFVDEARAAAHLSHPGIVRVLALELGDEGQMFQVQELVDGVTLEERLRHGALPLAMAARLGAAVADALADAHARGVVHRDVKPSNLMLTRAAPGVKLLDFGVARLGDEGVTADGDVVGTPAYMAPEQRAAGEVGPAADVCGAAPRGASPRRARAESRRAARRSR
jgi:serine/threonine protein kinase